MRLTRFAFRCPHCGNEDCTADAIAGWDVVRQKSVMLDEYDGGWCDDCGKISLDMLVIIDPAELARLDAARAKLALGDAAAALCEAFLSGLAWLTHRRMMLRHGPIGR